MEEVSNKLYRFRLHIGVQVAARPWREDVALAVSQQIETALGASSRPAF